jgi:hypothetical protein
VTGDTFPMSSAQRRLWFLHELDPTGYAQSTGRCFRVTGALDLDALRTAVDLLVARHEPLRTVFPVTAAGEPVQRVRPAGHVPVREPVQAGEREAVRRAVALMARPFDLAGGPLLRVAVIRLAPGEHLLVVAIHLLAADGWALQVLFEELATLYGDRTADLPPLPVQYVDWAAWQAERLTGRRRAELLDWWRRELSAAPLTLDLEPARPRGAGPPLPRRTHRVLSPAVTRAAAELARTERQTVFAVLAAACALVLGRRGGQERLLIGLAVSNRERPEVQRVLGFFVNTVALSVDLTGDPAFHVLVRRVAAAAGAAYAHQDLPFEDLVAELRPRRDPARSPVVQLAFAHHPAGTAGALTLRGCSVRECRIDAEFAKFELTIRAEETGDGGLVLWGEHDAALVDAATVGDLLTSYEAVLLAAASRPQARLSALLPSTRVRGSEASAALSDTALPDVALREAAVPDAGGPVERAVARIFAEVLGVPEPGRDENFFDLGGHSFPLVTVRARLRTELCHEIPLRDLYAAPTAAAVAARLTRIEGKTADDE